MAKKITYTEPADYFPESVRKAAGLGEFAPQPEKPVKKPTKKKGK